MALMCIRLSIYICSTHFIHILTRRSVNQNVAAVELLWCDMHTKIDKQKQKAKPNVEQSKINIEKPGTNKNGTYEKS